MFNRQSVNRFWFPTLLFRIWVFTHPRPADNMGLNSTVHYFDVKPHSLLRQYLYPLYCLTMFRIFRRIREEILLGKKTRRYLSYAVGLKEEYPEWCVVIHLAAPKNNYPLEWLLLAYSVKNSKFEWCWFSSRCRRFGKLNAIHTCDCARGSVANFWLFSIPSSI